MLLATERAFCLGLGLHITDTFLAELSSSPRPPKEALRLLLRPFVAVLAAPGAAPLCARSLSALLQPLCSGAEGFSLSPDELRMVSSLVFDSAADPGSSVRSFFVIVIVTRAG